MDPITQALEDVRAQLANDSGGVLADYIPQLATVDPDRFGIALAGMHGSLYRVGDDGPFTIQSVSKPFVYALALAEHGIDAVLARVGAEPSGDAFDSISIDPITGRPANPMINAGAILTTSLITASGPGDRFATILGCLSAFAGRPLSVDEATFDSERDTGDRNRALAYLMRSAGALTEPPDEVTEVYFRQCAVLVTAADVAVMAATLANDGVNPRTGIRVVGERAAASVLTVMATCGMYDHSGEWLLRAGLPAKSGVSGAIAAASPAQFGVGLFSPLVDERGNSVRGSAAIRRLSEDLELDLIRHPGLTAPVVSWRGDGSSIPADRPPATAVRQPAGRVVALGLQGDLDFAAVESLQNELLGLPGAGAEWLILDLARVSRVRPVASRLLTAVLGQLTSAGVAAAVTGPEAVHLPGVRCFDQLAAALAWCNAKRPASG